MNIHSYLKKQSKKVERALESCLPRLEEHPLTLHEAMHYAVMSGGKRIRPIFALAACQAVGGDEKRVMRACCAIELIHNYSLVHDDLPCMDDDDWRRGKPSCHVKFGEETAVLVGDALLTLAFKILSTEGTAGSARDHRRQLDVIGLIAEAIGSHGMVGGQALDMEFRGKEIDLPTIEYINTHKSGALIAVSVRAGAYLAGGNKKQVEALYRYGKTVGLLFQVVDDMLDREGYAKVIGLPEAVRQARRLHELAEKQLLPFGKKGRILKGMADYILSQPRNTGTAQTLLGKKSAPGRAGLSGKKSYVLTGKN